MTDNLIKKTFAGCLVLEKIGQGGMGIVYKAHHIKLNKVVCIKILAKELEADPRNIDFFLREAEISKQLDHPNTIHVYDYGKEKDNYYIIMSYVEGRSLDNIVSEKKFLDLKEASDIMLGVFEGLSHAHSKNIIHRDIKPSNIIITKDGIPRIIDFGLARRLVEEKQLTITGEMIGTAYFMSPEQGKGIQVDHRSDLYSAGATYFYILTGRYPFDGKSAIEVISKHINEPIPNLYQIKPDLPIWTVRMIEKLMKKNPNERYQTADEVVSELKKYKEKNYDNDLENTIEFDINELKNKQDEISKTIRLKTEDSDVIPNIEIVTNESLSHKITKDKEKSLTKNNENESLVANNVGASSSKNLQSKTFYLFSRLVYHFFITFVGIFSLYIFSSFVKINADKDIINKLLSHPYYLIFLVISIFSFYFVFKKFKIRSIILYVFFVFLAFYASYINMYNDVEFLSFFDIIIYFFKNINFGIGTYLILSLFFLFVAVVMKFKNRLMKVVPYILFLISVYFYYVFISYITGFNIKDVKYIYIFIFATAFFTFYFKKNLLFIFYIIFAVYLFSLSKHHFIAKNLESVYMIKTQIYNEEIEKTQLAVKNKIYENILNYDSNQNIDSIIEKEIEAEIAKIPKPDKKKIEKEISLNFFRKIKNKTFIEMKKSISLIFILSWFYLNFLFIWSNIKREDYEL